MQQPVNPPKYEFKDTHGQTHYVMAYADDDKILMQGETVLLVSQDGVYFKAIKNVNGVLVND